MIIDDKNQNDIINFESINPQEIEYVFSDKPINRIKTKPEVENKSKLLENLKEKIIGSRVEKKNIQILGFC